MKRRCRPNPCLNDGVCEESENDFICSCKQGFRGQRCEGRCANDFVCDQALYKFLSENGLQQFILFCPDQDQCAPNPCKNGGRCVSVGLHGNGKAFVCECANGFNGDTCEGITKRLQSRLTHCRDFLCESDRIQCKNNIFSFF